MILLMTEGGWEEESCSSLPGMKGWVTSNIGMWLVTLLI